jgi:hypothetical protein
MRATLPGASVPVASQRRATTQARVLLAASAWWYAHRPVGWSLSDHLGNPAINCGARCSEGLLAAAVADLVRERRKQREREAKIVKRLGLKVTERTRG